MITIYKYPVRPNLSTIRVPADSEILCVDIQHGEPQMWVKLDTEKPLVSRRVKVCGTGNPVDPTDRYIGTFQTNEGMFVWHLFEETAHGTRED